MEGKAGKELAPKKEISGIWSHKIPMAWEHTLMQAMQRTRNSEKQKVVRGLGVTTTFSTRTHSNSLETNCLGTALVNERKFLYRLIYHGEIL